MLTHSRVIAGHRLPHTPLEARLLDIGSLVTARYWYDVPPDGLGSLFFPDFVSDGGGFEAPRFARLVRDLAQDYAEHPEYAPTVADQAPSGPC